MPESGLCTRSPILNQKSSDCAAFQPILPSKFWKRRAKLGCMKSPPSANRIRKSLVPLSGSTSALALAAELDVCILF